MRATDGFVKLIGFFLNEELPAKSLEGFRARFTIGTVLLLFVLTLSLYAIWLLSIDKPTLYEHGTLSVSLAIELGILIIAALTKNVVLASNLFHILFGLLLAFVVLVTGGIHSPAITVTLIIPVTATAMRGWKNAVGWFILLTFYVSALFYLDLKDVNLPIMFDNEHFELLKISFWFIGASLVFVAFAIYEAHSDNLHRILHSEKEEYAYLSKHDALTGLSNRQCFDDMITQAIERGKRLEEYFALIYFDLDGFKPINDQHGHQIGDSVLRNVANRTKASIRQSDYVARLGGDEFALILHGISCPDKALSIAEKVVRDIQEPMYIQKLVFEVSVSAGIVIFPEDADNANDLIKFADKAMYRVKGKAGACQRYRDFEEHSQIENSASSAQHA